MSAMEVVYRGIFQKTLARNIVRSIVFAARKEGKIGAAFGRYGDSPERNGIPAKQFAIVSDSPEELVEPGNSDFLELMKEPWRLQGNAGQGLMTPDMVAGASRSPGN